MITWIQIRVQKHLKLLFASLLVVMVVTFVLTIGNQSFFGSHDNARARIKDFYGYNLASEGTKSYLETVARISLQLNPELRMQTPSAYDLEAYSHSRAAALSIAKSLGIVEPDDAQLRAHVKTMVLFQDEKGVFSAQRYKMIMDAFRTGMRVPESTVLSVLSDDWRIAQVRALLGGAGFVSPEVIALQRQSAGTKWTFAVAQVPSGTFSPKIDSDDATLLSYYEANKARFQIPEKLLLKQVRFPAVAFVADVAQPTDAEVEAAFQRGKARYRPADLKADAEGKYPDFAMDGAIRARVVQDIVQARAVQMAAQKADEFTMVLWREEVPADSPRVTELATSLKAQVTALPAFAKGAPPASPDARPSDIDSQWTLAASERYFSDVVSSPGGASVFLYMGTIPSRMPSFDEVKGEVLSTYQDEKKNELFAARGEELRCKLQAAVKAGRSFEDTAKALGLTVSAYSDLKLDAAPAELMIPGGPLEIVTRLEDGAVAPMQLNEKGGFIAYLTKRDIPAFDTVQAAPDEVAALHANAAIQDGWGVVDALSARRQSELEKIEHGEKKAE